MKELVSILDLRFLWSKFRTLDLGFGVCFVVWFWNLEFHALIRCHRRFLRGGRASGLWGG